MKQDYLWDRSGPPDPEIERLERALAPLRYRHRADLIRETARAPRAWWAVAAAVVLSAAGLTQLSMPGAPHTAWEVAGMQGAARYLRSGQLLRTGRGAQITLESENVGRIDLGPNSELRASTDRKVRLEKGVLHAFIWAPAREFVVDTPSARTVDLGCEYTLNVDPSGNGLVRVTLGWVAFQFADRESFIPAGAQCATRRRGGPGIPYFEDASDEFRGAVAAFESSGGGDRGALARILQAARPRDGLTLWHLLTRVGDSDRGLVFDRFSQLVTLPNEVSRAGVLRKDAPMIDLCWNALDLENTGWWRGWERKW
jgi:FecR protein